MGWPLAAKVAANIQMERWLFEFPPRKQTKTIKTVQSPAPISSQGKKPHFLEVIQDIAVTKLSSTIIAEIVLLFVFFVILKAV